MLERLSILNRKLARDLAKMRGQVITIAVVVAAGVASFIALQATQRSLAESRDVYYERYRFGDVFADLERAPESVADRLAAIPGVRIAYPRLVSQVRIPLGEAGAAPPIGQVVGLPSVGEATLNGVLVREGRMVEPGRHDEALLLEAFATRWGIVPGDTIPVIMEGVLRHVRITGTAMSPEFVYPAPPGPDPIPDDERFAVLWMDRRAVSAAFDMEGAFNNSVIRLDPGASEAAVMGAVDRILEPYGGRGAVGRDLQRSNFFLQYRLEQLESMAVFVPLLFLGVAAFLLNVVLSRLVNLQRGEIAAMKALGYQDREIAGYFLRFVAVVVVLGTVLGVAWGAWLGQGITGFFTRFFRLPYLEYGVAPGMVAIAFGVAFLFGSIGALTAVRSILRLSPAEAMAPPAPARYRPSLLERLGVGSLVGDSGRMVIREVSRRPVRTLLSSLGIALAIAVVVTGGFSSAAFGFIMDHHYYRATREDVTVALVRPASERAVREVGALPEVIRAEGVRTSPVRMGSEHRWRDVALHGYPEGALLRRLLDSRGDVVPLPRGGVLLTEALATMLAVGPGDSVWVELREGRSGVRTLLVTGLVDESFGIQGHMRLADLNALLGEGPTVSTLLLSIDRGTYPEVEARLGGYPGIHEVTSKEANVRRVDELSAAPMRAMAMILTLFGSVIAVGIVYNNARVALSTRARDLASLRVLGFTRKEISSVLLGELAIEFVIAVPAGILLGRGMAALIVGTMPAEQYRFPLVVATETYAFAVTVVLMAAVASALLVRKRLDRLDLIGVLKTRE